jgi:hypothetical protein
MTKLVAAHKNETLQANLITGLFKRVIKLIWCYGYGQQAMAKEFSTRGVTVNAVCPGFIESDMTAELNAEVTHTHTRLHFSHTSSLSFALALALARTLSLSRARLRALSLSYIHLTR